ncbi:hypothetical protein ACC754_35435 [Rhizobium johnstonii]|uniref:hypothetical protein n=1 Tax=Rhizobium johnstonii TaxID=3019933 RepID=UPI003F9C95F1
MNSKLFLRSKSVMVVGVKDQVHDGLRSLGRASRGLTANPVTRAEAGTASEAQRPSEAPGGGGRVS